MEMSFLGVQSFPDFLLLNYIQLAVAYNTVTMLAHARQIVFTSLNFACPNLTLKELSYKDYLKIKNSNILN